MDHIFDNATGFTSRVGATNSAVSAPALQAYQILRLGFTVAPIAAGLDKFFHILGLR
jgi:hypothetical protein